MYEALGLLGVILAVFIPLVIRFEHRMTCVETKLDVLLEHDGLNPADCIKDERKQK